MFYIYFHALFIMNKLMSHYRRIYKKYDFINNVVITMHCFYILFRVKIFTKSCQSLGIQIRIIRSNIINIYR